MTSLKQKLINFKYQYIGAYLFPAFILFFAFGFVINFVLNTDTFFTSEDISASQFIMEMTPMYIFVILGPMIFILFCALWERQKERTLFCLKCSNPAKYIADYEFLCTNPTCDEDVIKSRSKKCN